MSSLTNNATAAAVLAAFPCYPVPPDGHSPAIDALRNSQSGRGLTVGRDGVMLIMRRPWLAIDIAITPPLDVHVPFGSVGEGGASLRCGLIPGDLRETILTHLRAALPNEAAAFVIWHEATGEFAIDFPVIDEATPSRLVYRTPILTAGWHLVCDIHSHGTAPAFFSSTDDADDVHATKMAIVFGNLDAADGPTTASRLCAGGMFLPMTRNPFAGEPHAE